MEKLFGVPIQQLMLVLLALFLAAALVMSAVALRNPVIFKMALRNIPRRPSQTVLIVLGLMLATVLFSASFTTGDTLTHSIRVQSVESLGQVDEIVRTENPDALGRRPFFSEGVYRQLGDALRTRPEVDGIAPLAVVQAPVLAPGTRLSEPAVTLLGLSDEHMAGFDRPVDTRGQALSTGALAAGEAYISRQLAEKLGVGDGDGITAYLGASPTAMRVAGTYVRGAHPAGELSAVVPLSVLQELTGNRGRINAVAISNRGDEIDGAVHTDTVISLVEPVLEGSGLEVAPVKQEALDDADTAGSSFSSVFLIFGQFSIAAGILLVFLIFVMLAAERKRELGVSRAIGTQRSHVIRMFTFEGTAYAVMAGAVGSLLGIVVGWAMVRIMAAALGQVDLDLVYSFNWRSLVIAYTLGTVLTAAIVLVSSWRVSRLNIVRAVRDLPEPRASVRGLRTLLLNLAVLAIGLLMTVGGLQATQGSTFMLGTSLVIIGLPLAGRRFGLGDRFAFTVAGAGLVAWWLLPADVLDGVLPEMQQGIEIFFLSGIMIVLGAVWAVTFNSDLLLAATVAAFGRIRGLPPILRTAVSYPMHNRFRTGLTLAMFSLVVFTLIVMAFILHAIAGVYSDPERIAGGFHVRANTSPSNPVPDLATALRGLDGIDPDGIEAVGSFNVSRVRLKQEGSQEEAVDFLVSGADAGYTETVTYDLSMVADGFESPRAVWAALQRERGLAVVSSWMVPSRTNFNVGGGGPPIRLEGFWLEDDVLPEVYLATTDPASGLEGRLRVIGVLEQTAFYGPGVVASQDTVRRLTAEVGPPQSYMIRLRDSADAPAVTRALKAGFLEHGMQAEVLADEVRENASASIMINNLLQGFMGLGLVVGIAALGVIAARSVVERRHEIGVLRALGFQKGMVQASFLLESSYIALLGIGIGVALGFGISYNVVTEISKEMGGTSFGVPWVNLASVVAIAYVASLLTTFLPARQAANIYPVQALRYE